MLERCELINIEGGSELSLLIFPAISSLIMQGLIAFIASNCWLAIKFVIQCKQKGAQINENCNLSAVP